MVIIYRWLPTPCIVSHTTMAYSNYVAMALVCNLDSSQLLQTTTNKIQSLRRVLETNPLTDLPKLAVVFRFRFWIIHKCRMPRIAVVIMNLEILEAASHGIPWHPNISESSPDSNSLIILASPTQGPWVPETPQVVSLLAIFRIFQTCIVAFYSDLRILR